MIKEFDVPLVLVPGRGWFNWFGGTPRPYDVRSLRVDNNWPAKSFEEWIEVVKASLRGKTSEAEPDNGMNPAADTSAAVHDGAGADVTFIRTATGDDVEALCSLDLVAHSEAGRREFIEGSVAAGTCHVAVVGGEVVGYAVLNYTFYQQGFVEMLYVHAGHRRRGAGGALLRELEGLCRTRKLFTSTNLSNLPMQALLNRLGYKPSGVIHNLDEGDPEIVYFKRLG